MARCKPTSEWVVKEENVPSREQLELMVNRIMPLLRIILRPGQVRKEASDGERDGECLGGRGHGVQPGAGMVPNALERGSDIRADQALVGEIGATE